jgi:predicted transposase/invertase (TIGR01784 family)
MTSHDRAFKQLLNTFFPDFLELFFPALAAYLDKSSLVAQDKEIFTDLTKGETHEVDLLFKARVKDSESFFLVHVESEAQRKSDFPRRMFTYFARLHEKYSLKVYPIVVFSFNEPKVLQPSTYNISFPNLDVLRFRFETVQLNRLNWKDYANQENPMAAALMAKMKIAPDERWVVECKSIELVAKLSLPTAQAKLITGFVDTYIKPTAAEKAKINAEIRKLNPEQQEKVMEIIETSWSREAREQGILLGIQQGREQGIQQGRHLGMAALLTRQLTKLLGGLDSTIVDRIQQLEEPQLEALGEVMLDFSAIADLQQWLNDTGRG